MKIEEYEEATLETAIYPRGKCADERLPEVGVLYCTLGLVGESGEVAEKIKKAIREGDPEYIDEAEDELSDVLWYLARLADELGVSLEELAERNLEKLQDRKDRGKIEGKGDNR